ncbi:hypothetical protein QJS10_CPA02g01369 [Acorus calamus]|uniref:Uncharacterized protein n=1 Tax=Acorus calamus TaxID=4465 RepID=A0AAV9FED4_ACOCL|nr:hypothetical protein QJS10_CPA02g01369 [Acorus calamus]
MTHIAKGVFGLVPEFAETVAWRVGDMSHVRFWEDAWCGTFTLHESFPLAFQAAACKDSFSSYTGGGQGTVGCGRQIRTEASRCGKRTIGGPEISH